MRLFNGIRLLILLLWPTTLLAAPAFQQSFDSVPGIAWLVASALSTLGGVTALMYRLQMQLENPEYKPVNRLWALVVSQMLCSWLAGAIFFLLGLHWEFPLFLLGASVAVASFGGAKSIESVASWLVTRGPQPPNTQP
jgi:hypothetical protein